MKIGLDVEVKEKESNFMSLRMFCGEITWTGSC
jgi:hypothetical protein